MRVYVHGVHAADCLLLLVNRRRDLVAMTSTVDLLAISQHMELFVNLLKVLETQIVTMEKDFFEVSNALARDADVRTLHRPCHLPLPLKYRISSSRLTASSSPQSHDFVSAVPSQMTIEWLRHWLR